MGPSLATKNVPRGAIRLLRIFREDFLVFLLFLDDNEDDEFGIHRNETFESCTERKVL